MHVALPIHRQVQVENVRNLARWSAASQPKIDRKKWRAETPELNRTTVTAAVLPCCIYVLFTCLREAYADTTTTAAAALDNKLYINICKRNKKKKKRGRTGAAGVQRAVCREVWLGWYENTARYLSE